MSSEQVMPRNAGDGPPVDSRLAWNLAVGGLIGVTVAAAVNIAIEGLAPTPDTFSSQTGFTAIARLALAVGGILAAGLAVWFRPTQVGILSAACLTGLVARFAFHPAWDSARMLAGFGSIAAGSAAVLMALPQNYRRLAVSVLVVLHFGSILTCVTGPPTHGSPPPWTTQSASVYLFRPYSQFVYLTNAYHFYSPEPGPASQVWFCIHYKKKDAKPGEDERGDSRWFKLPRRPEDMTDPLALSYYRRLSLTQQLEVYAPPGIPPEVARRREMRSQGEDGIPWHPELPRDWQYHPPGETIRSFLLPSYVRHVARLRESQHPDGAPIHSIKVYRVEHRILMPGHLKLAGFYDPQTYLPYFQGEFDPDGRQVNADDPMLYWLVPIIYVPKSADVPSWENPKDHPGKFKLVDGVNIHTRSNHEMRATHER